MEHICNNSVILAFTIFAFYAQRCFRVLLYIYTVILLKNRFSVMTKKLKLGIAVLAISCIILSCKHEPNFNTLPAVYYSTDIAPIISANCTFSGCHGDFEFRRFQLFSYYDVMKYCKVKAGSPQTSKLYKVVKSVNSEEVMPTPQYNPLTEKQIQLIYIWIGQGAKNN